MNIGDIIYSRRQELKLTLEDVGTAVGVGKSTVKKWESGHIENMKRDKIALLAQVLQLNPVTFITGELELNAKKPTPVSESELSADHQFLIDAVRTMSDENVKKLRIIVEQVLGERG